MNGEIQLKPRGVRGQVLGIIYTLALTIFVLIKEIMIPLTAQPKTIQNPVVIDQLTFRLTQLESKTESLSNKVDDLAEGQATRAEAITTLKQVVDRIERKLDTHMLK